MLKRLSSFSLGTKKSTQEDTVAALSVGQNGSDDLRKFCAVFEPFTEKSEGGEKLRAKGFRMADPNGNGLCSLAELEGFVLNSLLGAYPKKGKDDPDVGRDLFDAYRPCYIRAFNDAKDYKADDGKVLAGTKNATNDDFVSKGEFRLFATYLVIYGAMYDAFSTIDGGGGGRVGDDRKIDMAEWLKGYKALPGLGFVAFKGLGSDAEAEKVFKAIDQNGGGVVILGEFCTFLKDAEVKADTAVGLLLNEDEASKAPASGGEAAAAGGGGSGPKLADKNALHYAATEPAPGKGGGPPPLKGLKKGKTFSEKAPEPSVGGGAAGGAGDDLAKFCAPFRPYSEKTDESAALRKKGFRAADPNGNGLCSLAELEGFVLQTLLGAYPKKGKDEPEVGRDLFELYRPCYIRAFNDAKDVKADTGKILEGTKKATNDDFVSKGEFRAFNAMLVVYASMYDAFSKIDGGGGGRIGDDRKIDLSEWMAGYKGVTGYGFVAFQSLSDDESAKAVFAKMDDNGGGVVILEEFCTFLKNAEVSADTEMGRTLAEDEEGGGGAEGAAGDGASAEGGKKKKSEPVASFSFGLAVGKSVSKELLNFFECIAPLAEESESAEATRKEEFKAADPNGNGLCSLAELETWVLKALVTKYPKTGKGKDMVEPGKDIWDAFRPSYVRAFSDAKDYKADSGTKIKGTKSATDDDFVSIEEFRFFCAYLCIYAAMSDAFSRVDGGGAGRDKNDDRRIDLKEFEAGFKGLDDYGFVALSGVTSKKEAKALFDAIDDNGGGIVLMDEWCKYIKAAEIKAGSALGTILAADEAGGVGKAEKLPDVPNLKEKKDGESATNPPPAGKPSTPSSAKKVTPGKKSAASKPTSPRTPTSGGSSATATPKAKKASPAVGRAGLKSPRSGASPPRAASTKSPSVKTTVKTTTPGAKTPPSGTKKPTTPGSSKTKTPKASTTTPKSRTTTTPKASTTPKSTTPKAKTTEATTTPKAKSTTPKATSATSSRSTSPRPGSPRSPKAPASTSTAAAGAKKSATATTASGKGSSNKLDFGNEPLEAAMKKAAAIVKKFPDNRAMKHLLALHKSGALAKMPQEDLAGLYACVKTGLDNEDSGLGCYAMAPGDYDKYSDFFDAVCNDYHNNPKGDKVHVTNWSLDGIAGLPEGGQLDMAQLGLKDELSMRVRVGRNLTTFPLPGAMTKAQRIEFEQTMLKAFALLVQDPAYGGAIHSLTPHADWKEVTGAAENPNLMTPEKYDALVKAHVMFKDMDADPFLKSAGISGDWPCGRGCYQSADGGFIIWFGEEDQLRIMCMGKGFLLNSIFDRLRVALEKVESIEGIQFATSSKYGFVTSCPSNLGTGMRASVHLKIPNLTADGTDTKAVAAAKPLGLSVRGTGGEHTPIGADGTVDISPSNRLFITEAEIVTKLYNGVKLLLEKEDAAAKK